jgi:hypothetical protein
MGSPEEADLAMAEVADILPKRLLPRNLRLAENELSRSLGLPVLFRRDALIID